MKVIKVKEGTEIEVKRFYLPSVVYQVKCKKCGELIYIDYGTRYLSFPNTGEFEEYIYCDECDTEHYFTMRLDISISIDENTLKINK
jgi:RNase P subunit RPR2